MAALTWTAARRRHLEQYVQALAPVLRLADWTITVSWEEAPAEKGEEAPLAQMTPYPNTKNATLQLGPAFLGLKPAEQTHTLCHELVHCHLFPIHDMAKAAFKLLADGEGRMADIALVQQIEMATDCLAEAFLPFVPQFHVDGPVNVLPAATRPRKASPTRKPAPAKPATARDTPPRARSGRPPLTVVPGSGRKP